MASGAPEAERDPWRVAHEVLMAIAARQAQARGETIEGLADELSAMILEKIVPWLAGMPEELAAATLVAALTSERAEARDAANKVWSIYALPGGLPAMDDARNARIMARCFLMMERDAAEAALVRLWAEQPLAVYREIADFDPRAAACILKKLPRAREALVEALANVDFGKAYADAYYLRQEGRLDEAFTLLAKAIARRPDEAGPHNNMGNLLNDLGLSRPALAEYQRALELDPRLADAWYSMGCLLLDFVTQQVGNTRYEVHMYEEAEGAFRKAIEIAPDDVDSHHNLGVVLAETGRLDEARQEFLKVLELAPEEGSARENLAKLDHRR